MSLYRPAASEQAIMAWYGRILAYWNDRGA
jgi:hypothetical protein